MNYQKIYDKIIERAKIRQLEGYKEKHHIVPKCMGGSNTKTNLVNLTAKEHYMCHLLLCNIYPNNIKLFYALHRMIFSKCSNNKPDLYSSSRLYEKYRKIHSEIISGQGNPMYNKKHTKESKNKMSQSKKGRENLYVKGDNNPSKRSEVRKKISESRLGDKNPMKKSEVKEKMVKSLKKTMELKKLNGIPRYKTLICNYCYKEGGANNMSRYHFENCKQKLK